MGVRSVLSWGLRVAVGVFVASTAARAGPLSPFPAPQVAYAEPARPLQLVSHPRDGERWYVVVEDEAWGPRLFFLDTGFSRTTCDDDFVEELGLSSLPTLTRSRGALGSVPLRIAHLPDFSLGDHRVKDLACAVRDLGSTSSIPADAEVRVAGVIGANLLERFRLEVDPARLFVRLSEPSLAVGDYERGHRVAREWAVGHRRVAVLELDGNTTRAVVDTGASSTHVDTRGMDLDKVVEREAVVFATGPGGRAVQVQAWYRVERLEVAGRVNGPLLVKQRDAPPWRPGLLGLDVLGSHRLVLEPARNTLYLERVKPAPLPVWEGSSTGGDGAEESAFYAPR